jgi:hypothetical protein
MRCTLAPLLLGLLAAGPSGAAPLAFQAELAIVFAEGGLGEIVATGAGTAEVTPTSLQFALPAGLFDLQGTLAGPATGPVGEVRVAGSNASGWPAGGPDAPVIVCTPVCGPAPQVGNMPLVGSLELVPRDGGDAIVLPLSVVGAAPAATATFATSAGFGGFLAGGGWSLAAFTLPPFPPPATPPGTSTFTLPSTVITVPTFTLPPVVSGTDARTAGGLGRIQRVTPVHVVIGDDYRSGLSGYARLTVDFVPEPAPVALLAVGAAGLVAASRRPTRRR